MSILEMEAVRSPVAFEETELITSICRESFTEFVKEFWVEIPGTGKLVWNWHIGVMCDELQKAAERVFRSLPREYDLVCNISPGSTKSSIFSVLYMCWVWTRMPSAVFLSCTHTESLALDLANKSRFVIKSDKYQKCFPEIIISKDQDAKGDYMNTAGGRRLTCTVAGKSPMGRHADFVIIDDPLDPKKALSDVELQIAEDFIQDQLPSRKKDKLVAFTAMVMQRLAEGDPTGVMLDNAKKEGATPVRHICLPAEIEDERSYVHPPELREKYVDGLMDPIRLSRMVLKDYYSKMSEYAFSGQFRQAPVKPGGQMFKEIYFNKRVKSSPHNCKRVWYWDRASSIKTGACYTAGVLLGKDEVGNFYIENVIHGQWEPDERNQKMRAAALKTKTKYGPNNVPAIYTEAEGGSSGVDAWKGVARALAGFSVRQQQVSKMGNKEVRAEPWSCQLAAGNVYLVENGEWDINGYIKEHTMFPRGRLKDMVDASSGAFSILANATHHPGLRVLTIHRKRDKNLRIVLCNQDQLANLIIENKSLLIHISDPPVNSLDLLGPEPIVEHGLTSLLGTLHIKFADVDPRNFKENWEEPLSPWNKKPSELMMTQEIGKKLWGFLLKKRDFVVDSFIFCDENRARVESLVLGMSDVLHLPRKVVWSPDDPEDESYQRKDPAKITHIYDMTKATRNSVM